MNTFNQMFLHFHHHNCRRMELKISLGYNKEEVLDQTQELANGIKRKKKQIKCLSTALRLNILTNSSSNSSHLLISGNRKCKKTMRRVNLHVRRPWSFQRMCLNPVNEPKRMRLKKQGDNLTNRIAILFPKILHRITAKTLTLFLERIISNNNMNRRLTY